MVHQRASTETQSRTDIPCRYRHRPLKLHKRGQVNQPASRPPLSLSPEGLVVRDEDTGAIGVGTEPPRFTCAGRGAGQQRCMKVP